MIRLLSIALFSRDYSPFPFRFPLLSISHTGIRIPSPYFFLNVKLCLFSVAIGDRAFVPSSKREFPRFQAFLNPLLLSPAKGDLLCL